MTEIVKTLTINGEEYKAKGTFKFDMKAKEFATKDKEGKVEGDGFTNIFNGLLQRKTESIVDFWMCAVAHHKEQPSREQIEDAVMNVIDTQEGTRGLLQGAIDVLTESGYFKETADFFWFTLNQAPKLSKKEEREQAKMSKEFMVETYVQLTGKQPY